MKFARFVAGVVLSVAVGSASAQYPDKPIKVVNPYSPGGFGDTMQRIFATKMQEKSGKSIIVENKTGAGGRIGYDAVAKSAPDGYTFVGTDAGYTTLPGLFPKLPWDPAVDLVPVTIYVRTPFVLVANPKAKFKTLKEMLEYAKKNPGDVKYGSAGNGGINHLVMAMIENEAGVKLLHVPYKGMGEAVTGVMSGDIDVIATGTSTAVGPIKTGKVVPLAHTGDKRWPAIPEVPTLTELGVPVATYSWSGVMAPKGTPKAAIDFIYQNSQKVLQDPATKPTLDQQGVEAVGMSPEDMAKLIRDDTKRWTETIKAANIKVE